MELEKVNQQKEREWGLNGFSLKWIAMITMLIDHIGAVLFPMHMELRIIGRLAFPIYCFLLVEGAVHTSDWRKYLGRLCLFAVISEIPFNLAIAGEVFTLEYQNVFFTLALGLSAVLAFRHCKRRPAALLLAIFFIVAAEFLQTDYGGGGVLLILLLYLLRERVLAKCICFAAEIFLWFGGLEVFALFSLVPILCYNGRKGPGGLKYFFYVFYPVHLLLLYFLSICSVWQR